MDDVDECTDLMLYGPEVYERLAWDDRPQFDAEWEQILTQVGRDLDLAPIVPMLCRWWVATGGDAERAGLNRVEFADRSRARKISGNNLSGPCVCACRGPEIYDALPRDLAVPFARDMEQAAAEAIVCHDWSALWALTLGAYIETQATDEDRAELAAGLAEITAALEAGTLVGVARDV